MDTVHTQQTAYATGTLNNIRSHLRSYILFSLATGHPYLSLSIPHLCDYLVFLSHSLSYGTIRNYISSLRIFFELHHIHVDLFHGFYISLTLRGIKCLHGSSPSAKLPITPQLLVKLHSTINFASTLELVFWTACLLAFFTFFRKSNLFPSSSHQFDPARNLMRKDIQILSSFALVTVNWTKTIQFGERTISISIPRIPGSILCPGNALETYFHRVPVPISHCLPLFVYQLGSALQPFTYSTFIQLLCDKLSLVGLPPNLYSGHSFRHGGASFAFALHLPHELIQQQGDWKSDAYLRYLDKPLTQRLKVAFAFRDALKH